MKSLVTLLFLLLTREAFAQPSRHPETYHVLFLADSGVVVIQLSVLIEGKSPREKFQKFIDSMMQSLDTNHDGSVTLDESRGRVPTVRDASRSQVTAPGAGPVDLSLDVSPKDGKISRAEFVAYFKRLGFTPFDVRFQPLSQQVDQGAEVPRNPANGASLFSLLDSNADKQLSTEELARATAVLQKLDRDNDETISLAELQPLISQEAVARRSTNNMAPPAIPFVSLASGESLPKLIRRIIDKYDRADSAKSGNGQSAAKNQKLGSLELGLPDSDIAKYDVDGDGQLDFEELRQFVSAPRPTYELSLNLTEGKVKAFGPSADKVRFSDDGVAILQFGTTQIIIDVLPPRSSMELESAIQSLFAQLDANGDSYLEKTEFPDDASFEATFADFDADKNGKVYVDEIVAFMRIRLDAASQRVELSIFEQGRTLFDILDSDRDGRLSHRELRGLARKLELWDTNGDGQLTEFEIPLQFRMVAAQGSLSGVGPFTQNPTMSRGGISSARTSGPLWFQKMDRNRDGEVSRREFLGDLDLFDKLDINHDTAIDLNEAMTVHKLK